MSVGPLRGAAGGFAPEMAAGAKGAIFRRRRRRHLASQRQAAGWQPAPGGFRAFGFVWFLNGVSAGRSSGAEDDIRGVTGALFSLQSSEAPCELPQRELSGAHLQRRAGCALPRGTAHPAGAGCAPNEIGNTPRGRTWRQTNYSGDEREVIQVS